MPQSPGALVRSHRFDLLVAIACLMLPLTNSATTSMAQTAASPHEDSVLAYRADQEIRITASIQQIVAKRIENGPVGLHLMLAGPQGAYDASLGPYLSSEVKRSLTAGKSIGVIGAIETVRGQGYLLVRELVVDGKLIVVRNEKGFLVNARSGPRNYDSVTREGAR